MEYKIRGKKFKITEDVKEYVVKRLGKLDKYFDNPESMIATVLIKQEGLMPIVEVTIPAKKMILRAEEAHKDPLAAVDLVLDKLERQIRKSKTRMSKKVNRERVIDIATDFEIEKEEKDTSKVVKRKAIELKPMNEEEAILQMNLIDHTFFVFRNSKNGEIEVVYKRKDGNYGMLREK